MRPGPKPEPPTLNVVRPDGSQRGGPFASLRTAGVPPKPAMIANDPVASEEWDRLVALLDERRQLSPADAGILISYCSAYSRVERCLRAMQGRVIDAEKGTVQEFEMTVFNSETGAVKANPILGVLSGAETNLARFASLLGLTPTDRGRAKKVDDAPEDSDDLAPFLDGPEGWTKAR